MGSMRNCLNSLQELQTSGGNGSGSGSGQSQQQQISTSHFDHPTHDDFLDQMLSNLPSWTDHHHHHHHHHQQQLPTGNPKSPWDLNPNTTTTTNHHKLFNIPIGGGGASGNGGNKDLSEDPNYPCDDSTLLASRLRQHQISTGTSPKALVLQQQLLLSAAAAAAAAAAGGGGGGMSRSPSSGSGIGGTGTGDSVLFPLPLTLGGGGDSSDSRLIRDDSVDAPFKSQNGGDGPVQALFNGLTGGLPRTGQVANPQHFHHTQTGSISNQSFGGGPSTGMNQAPATVSAGGGSTAPTRQKVRARRGQATDPHSIAERLRRERIAERMKALQELVPNANKTDKASMLDEIIDYVKFLQLQVKVLSMSRLGGAAAVAPLVADISSEGGGDCIQASGGGLGRNNNNNNGTQTASTNDSLSVTEHQVAKLMEEDMGSAMQYLQGKGLCLMPISLATAISSATSHSRNANNNMMNHCNNPLLATNGDGPSSPSMSVLTVQSATMGNGGGSAAVGGGDQTSVKDVTSVSKP